MPNILVFEVEIEETKETVIVGGYTSCGWTSHDSGDMDCFIFNLT
jgi:hypothetical protein